MKVIQTILHEKRARAASRFLRVVCYAVMAFLLLFLVLALLGRASFTLHADGGAATYEGAIYAGESHGPSPSLTVHTSDDIHVWTNEEDQLDPAIQVGLFLLCAVSALPWLAAFWLLSRVFANISKGAVFVAQNANYLFFYGLLQCAAGLLVPLLKWLICELVSLVSQGRMAINASIDPLGSVVPGVAFLVAAYIMRYGMDLQDEVDHTI